MSDALGSVRQQTNANEVVMVAREWMPYGIEVGGGQAGPGYTGEWFDAALGLEYLRARWYDGGTGSFLTQDAVEENHPYLYVAGNPILYTDPSGESATDDMACQTEANYYIGSEATCRDRDDKSVERPNGRMPRCQLVP